MTYSQEWICQCISSAVLFLFHRSKRLADHESECEKPDDPDLRVLATGTGRDVMTKIASREILIREHVLFVPNS